MRLLAPKLVKQLQGCKRRTLQVGGRVDNHATLDDLWDLIDEHGWICAYCGNPLTADTAAIDHRVPLKISHDSSKNNLVLACRACNAEKHDAPSMFWPVRWSKSS